jgi:DNA replication protein DnaC
LFAKVHRDVLSRVKATFNVNSDLYGEGRRIEEELAAIPALVIDDLGVKTMTEFESELIYDIIDSRYDYNRLTIITSNDPIDSFREISQGRVTSRLREMCREIHLDVADHRLRHAL